MTHIMVDLETLSTKPNAMILAIGAVKFDVDKGVYDKFYQAIDTSAIPEGFHVSSDTLNWWANQSEEAQAVFTDPNAIGLDVALLSFFKWAINGTDQRNIRIWGNGASFDNVILSHAYDAFDLPKPWMFYNDRCYRTMKNVVVMRNDAEFKRLGTYHNAVDDAESQAVHLLAMGVHLA